MDAAIVLFLNRCNGIRGSLAFFSAITNPNSSMMTARIINMLCALNQSNSLPANWNRRSTIRMAALMSAVPR